MAKTRGKEKGPTFNGILQLRRLNRGPHSTVVLWEDRATGKTYKMRLQVFNALLDNEETQWEGPALIDGLWEVYDHLGDFVRPVHPSQI